MDNPYTQAYAPATMSNQQVQPVMQNTSAQDAYTQMAMQQGQQLGQQVANPPSNNMMALAQALRAGKKDNNSSSLLGDFYNKQMSGYMPWNQPSPTDATAQQISQLGSNSWNPLSNFNTGFNGWGNFGE